MTVWSFVPSVDVGMQAAQVRKSSFVAHVSGKKVAYHPETHHSCTIHAGTVIQQVSQLL